MTTLTSGAAWPPSSKEKKHAASPPLFAPPRNARRHLHRDQICMHTFAERTGLRARRAARCQEAYFRMINEHVGGGGIAGRANQSTSPMTTPSTLQDRRAGAPPERERHVAFLFTARQPAPTRGGDIHQCSKVPHLFLSVERAQWRRPDLSWTRLCAERPTEAQDLRQTSRARRRTPKCGVRSPDDDLGKDFVSA